jgi:hypothetical protein
MAAKTGKGLDKGILLLDQITEDMADQNMGFLDAGHGIVFVECPTSVLIHK